MAERDNSSSSKKETEDGSKKGDDKAKSPSRLRKSPIGSPKEEKKVSSPQPAGDPKLSMVYKAKPASPQPKDKATKDEDSSDAASNGNNAKAPKMTIISFSPRPKKSANGEATSPQVERFPISVETIMTKSKPLTLMFHKNQTVGALKAAVRSKTKARNFVIFYNNKELAPEDSTLESHGIVAECKVRLHIKTQSGTSDKEDINSLIRLSKSLNDLKGILGTIPASSGGSKSKGRVRPRPKQNNVDPEQKAREDEKTREKMAKLREKFSQRNGKAEDKTKKAKKKKSRRDGGIAGQYDLPTEVHCPSSSELCTPPENSDREPSKASPPMSTGSVVSVFEPSIDLGQGPVTCKELLLYFDPPETCERARFLAQELFEPPSNLEMLEKIRHEFKNLRCAMCHIRIPIALREMPCRCSKVYCQPHRNPFKHCCAVDLKKVDRIKLEKDIPTRASSVTQRKDEGEDDVPAVKSSTKKLL